MKYEAIQNMERLNTQARIWVRNKIVSYLCVNAVGKVIIEKGAYTEKKKVLLGAVRGRKTQPINFLFWLLLFDSCCQPLLLAQDWELGEMVSEERKLSFKLLLRGKLGHFLNQEFSDLWVETSVDPTRRVSS